MTLYGDRERESGREIEIPEKMPPFHFVYLLLFFLSFTYSREGWIETRFCISVILDLTYASFRSLILLGVFFLSLSYADRSDVIENETTTITRNCNRFLNENYVAVTVYYGDWIIVFNKSTLTKKIVRRHLQQIVFSYKLAVNGNNTKSIAVAGHACWIIHLCVVITAKQPVTRQPLKYYLRLVNNISGKSYLPQIKELPATNVASCR